MKKKLLFVSVAFMALSTMQAQDGVGIGKSIIPDGSAVLDIGATDKGVLIPRVALTGETDAATIKGAAPSLLVFNTATAGELKPGYYFWLDGKWNALVSKTTEKTDETLTSLKIVEDLKSKELTLLYVDESGLDNTLLISEELQKNDKFQEWIASQVNSVDLIGDVTGTAQATKVVSIQGVRVNSATPTLEQALIFDGTEWKPGMPKIDGGSVTFNNELKSGADGVINVADGKNAMLKDVTLSINNKSIQSGMIGDGEVKSANIGEKEVKTNNIEDKAVTVDKIEPGSNTQLLSVEGGKAKWIDQGEIKPDAMDLNTDSIIVIAESKEPNKDKLEGAVMVKTTLSIKDKGIETGKIADNAVTNEKVANNTLTVDKLAIVDTNKNNRLVTDNAGQPVWESKYTTISSTPVATNEVMDDKKVYTVKFDNAVVEEGQPGVGYNTAIKALPKIDNLEYLLRAEIYDGANKLVVSSVTDVVNTDGVLTFRFGMNKMYSTLPAATNYKVVLKYVSTEAVVTP
ncbi:hypothetical protein ACKLNQ_17930 [Myroides odoratimimus]|uniref:hypothetical protein n=1 Tax=Myroides odoratimimus TaxID=76832 RepID=UPI0038D431C1